MISSYGHQSISSDDVKAVSMSLMEELLTTGPKVAEFEERLESITGTPTITVSSGTAALHCAFSALELKQDDEIITPPLTFIATQATAALMGAKIVFADIQEDTGNIDPEKVESAITNKTRAIVAVDYAGHPCDLRELKSIAEKYQIYLIEDAAHSFGSTYRGKPIGSIADMTTFSFFPTKNFTTGEGGALASIHPELLSRAKKFARQGIVREPEKFLIKNEGPWHQEVHSFGVNYRLPDILCSLGISQLSRISSFKKKREEIFNRYNEFLSFESEIKLPVRRDYVDPMWHLYPIRVPSNLRREVFQTLKNNGIGVQVNYFPAHLQPVFSKLGHKKGDFPVSEKFYEEEISIPMHCELLVEEQMQIIKILKSLVL